MTDPYVVVDTDVFSTLFVTRPRGRDTRDRDSVDTWAALLRGRTVLLAFVTAAEVRVGAQVARWGDRRRAELGAVLARFPIIPVDPDVSDAYVRLTAEAHRAGHGIQAPQHANDRWVAACAMAKELPLLSGDQIYREAPGVRLLDEESDD